MQGRILIIDPDEDQLAELKSVLVQQGYSVETARNGLEGLRKGKLFQPDVVITELLLDRLSGFEVSSRIAAEPGFQARVIFYTGFYRDEYTRKEVTSKYGAVDYFIKPFQQEALKKAVAVILSQRERTTPVVPQQTETEALAGSSEEESQNAKQSEDDVRAAAEPAHSSESQSDESSPLSAAMDEAARLAEKKQETIVVTGETVSPSESLLETQHKETATPEGSPEPVSPQPEAEPPAKELAAAASNELNILSSTRRFLVPPSIYKSRSFQGVAILILLFLSVIWFRGRRSEDITQKVRQRSTAVPPSSQNGSTPAPPSADPRPSSNQQPVKENTSPATISSSSPDNNNPGQSAISEPSTSVPAHASQTLSARRAPTREIQNSRPGGAANVVISDVTGAGRSPFLRKLARPVVAPEMIESASPKPVVIRILISREGKVLEAIPVNQDDGTTSLTQAALAAVQNWEFQPVRKSDEKTWTKYFSFKLARRSD